MEQSEVAPIQGFEWFCFRCASVLVRIVVSMLVNLDNEPTICALSSL